MLCEGVFPPGGAVVEQPNVLQVLQDTVLPQCGEGCGRTVRIVDRRGIGQEGTKGQVGYSVAERCENLVMGAVGRLHQPGFGEQAAGVAVHVGA